MHSRIGFFFVFFFLVSSAHRATPLSAHRSRASTVIAPDLLRFSVPASGPQPLSKEQNHKRNGRQNSCEDAPNPKQPLARDIQYGDRYDHHEPTGAEHASACQSRQGRQRLLARIGIEDEGDEADQHQGAATDIDAAAGDGGRLWEGTVSAPAYGPWKASPMARGPCPPALSVAVTATNAVKSTPKFSECVSASITT